MANSTNSWLSPDDVCKIFEAASKNGVTKLKFGTLEAFFGTSMLPGSMDPQPVKSGLSAEQIAQNQEIEEKNAIEADELKTREDQIAELLISDPLLAEELMRQGELTEETDDRSASHGEGEAFDE